MNLPLYSRTAPLRDGAPVCDAATLDGEAALLTSPQAPIVLLERRADAALAPDVAPGHRRLGVMLSSEDIHRQLAALDQKGIRLLPEDIRETLSQGERETWIVPARVAEALRGIGDRLSKQDNALEAAAKFTLGIWNEEVRQDPEHLYTGEELALSIRSFTHGYDLFNPSRNVAWQFRIAPRARFLSGARPGTGFYRGYPARRRSMPGWQSDFAGDMVGHQGGSSLPNEDW